MKKTLSILSIALLVLMGACAGLGPTDEENDTGTDAVSTTDNGDGTFRTEVQTTDGSSTEFAYFDLVSGEGVIPDDPGDSTVWHLAFLNYDIIVNGGESGSGSVTILGLDGEDFSALTQAPEDDYFSDSPDPDPGNPYDGDGYAFNQAGGWYTYNPQTHEFSVNDKVYVIHCDSGYYKMKIASFVSTGPGSPMTLAYDWGQIAAP